MARIRSVHPGLFTDEAFVSCGALARLLLIGLWTEADDQGVFEWKPITLKMRILPVDNVDVDALLDELSVLNVVRSYEHDGRKYGAIRNFRKYQRPKKPNSVHFIPPEFRTYVGLSAPSSEPEPVKETPVPKKSEIAPQMEDGGGRRRGNSVPNGTGGTPPTSSQWIYAKAKELLSLAEKPPKDAGSLVTKWLRDHGEGAVMDALRMAETKRSPEPVALIEGLLRKRKHGPPQRIEAVGGMVIPDH
jgi:hypothetical protein